MTAETDIRNINASLPTEDEVETEAIRRSSYTFGIYKVAGIEDKKFLLLALIFFLIAFNYSLMSELKKTFLLLRQTQISAQYLKTFSPFLAIGISLVIQNMLTYTTNMNILKNALFVCSGIFAVFIALFSPYINFDFDTQGLSDIFADNKMKFFGFEPFVAIFLIGYCWTSSILFIVADLYGSFVLSLLFLSFCNDVCPRKQFFRFLPLLFVVSNLALVCSAFSLFALQYIKKNSSYIIQSNIYSGVFGLCAAFSVISGLLVNVLEKSVLNQPMFIVEGEQKKKKKVSIGFAEGLKTAASSKIIIGICLIVLIYNFSYNIADAMYNSSLKMQNLPEDRIMFRQFVTQIITGSCTIVLLLTPFSKIVHFMGWTKSGLITPIYAMFALFAMLSMATIVTSLNGTNHLASIAPLIKKIFKPENLSKYAKLEVDMGTAITGLFKVFKYASFDVSKEAISMRIDPNLRPRFKAVYDGMCGKFGKFFGTIISIICGFLFNTKDVRITSVYFLVLLSALFTIWIASVVYLGAKYNEAVKNNTLIDLQMIGTEKKVES